MRDVYLAACEAAEFIAKKTGAKATTALILGSGLGSLTDEMEGPVDIDYGQIPGFLLPSVKSHAGKLVWGCLGGKPLLAMKGRSHYYEGCDVERVVFPIRVFKVLGIKTLLVTNSAGGINREFKPGDLMVIKDHISLFAPSPLRGRNLEEFGPRFPDMTRAYDPGLIKAAKEAAERLNIEIKEGVYAFTRGPMYETPAEIRALAVLGADAVGMSTVPEVIVARHSGIRVLGISCISNMAAGISQVPLSHEEVTRTAETAGWKFRSLIKEIVTAIGEG